MDTNSASRATRVYTLDLNALLVLKHYKKDKCYECNSQFEVGTKVVSKKMSVKKKLRCYPCAERLLIV